MKKRIEYNVEVIDNHGMWLRTITTTPMRGIAFHEAQKAVLKEGEWKAVVSCYEYIENELKHTFIIKE